MGKVTWTFWQREPQVEDTSFPGERQRRQKCREREQEECGLWLRSICTRLVTAEDRGHTLQMDKRINCYICWALLVVQRINSWVTLMSNRKLDPYVTPFTNINSDGFKT